MSRTYKEDKMLYDPYSVETRNLTRELDRLNKEIECLRSKSFENAPDFSQSTPINQATWPRQSDSGFCTSIIPDPDFGTGSNILQSSNVGKGAAKSKDMSRPIITDKYIPASKKIATEDELGIYKEDKSIHKSKNIIKPATYDGQGSFIDYKSHFDACSSINGWTETEKGLYLAVSLRGQAQGVLGNLPTDKRQAFKDLVRSLEERFSPANQTELYRTQLRERRQKASESLPELGQDIRRLANLSYPTAPNDVRETLAKEQFIDGLMSVDMRLRIKQARPSDLNDAIRHAVELEAFDKAEIKQNGKGYLRAITRDGDNSDIKDKTIELLKNMQTALSGLQEEVKALKQTREPFKNRGCFNCGKFGHFKKDCPESSVKRGPSNSQNLPEFSREKQNGVIGVNKLANEAGMFIEAKVNGCKAKMLIDTGATVSLISKKLFDRMGSHVLSPMDRDILTTNGSPLIVFGKTIIDIEINGDVCSNIAVIADLNVDGILGIDFQRSQSCVINITKGNIWVNGRETRLHFEGQIGCYGAYVASAVQLPPRCEVLVSKTITETVLPIKEKVSIVDTNKGILVKNQEKTLSHCYQCSKVFKKSAYRRRHMKRFHRNDDVKIAELKREQDVYSKDEDVNRDKVSENDSSENEDDDIKEPDTNVKTSDKVCLKGLSKRKTTQEKNVAPKQKELLKIPTEEDNMLQAAYTVLFTVPRAFEQFIDREYKGGFLQAILDYKDQLKTKLRSEEWDKLSQLIVHHRLFHFYDQIIQDTILDNEVLDLLISKCILKKEDREEIEQQLRQSDRNKCILDLLIQRPQESYSVLLEVLKECHTCFQDLIECMEGQLFPHHKVVSQTKDKSYITGFHSVRLQKNYHNLTQNLSNTESIIDSLISRGVLDPDDRAEIVSSRVQAKINRKLIDKIKSEQDYIFFLEALNEDPTNSKLTSDLESTDVKPDELKLLQRGQILDTEPERHHISLSADLYRLQSLYKKMLKMTIMDSHQYQQFVQTVNEILVRIGGDPVEIKLDTGMQKLVKKLFYGLKDKEEHLDLKEKIKKMETELEEVIPKNIRDVDQCRDDGVTALHIASQEGQTNVVKLLLERNPRIDLCANNGGSSLFSASQNGHTNIVRMLLERNPNVDLCNTIGCCPLSQATQNGHTDIVKLLLNCNPNVDLCDNNYDLCTINGISPLFRASQFGHTDIVRLLLEKKSNVDLCDNNGTGPLYMACHEGHTDIVRLLLDKNPNIYLCDSNGCSPLIIASQKGHTDIVRLLSEKNQNIDLNDDDLD
ncbi:unnamed protein product [Mytilus edulis]|uniref:Uncharacterized protein n=1 Tax=Mytilus edulis TaxID=6550 RepID=A0A8S3QHK6_MYTED|nr:unnamed protein product [Mytilus edulis]